MQEDPGEMADSTPINKQTENLNEPKEERKVIKRFSNINKKKTPSKVVGLSGRDFRGEREKKNL